MQLWAPIDKYIVVTGIVTPTRGIVSGGDLINSEIRSAWAPIFAKQHVDNNAIGELFASIPPPNWNWKNVAPPTEHTVYKCIQHSSDSGVGRDGIPNSAWKAAGLFGACLLHKLIMDMCTYSIIPWGLNHLRKCFIPKKRFISHLHGIAAAATDLRPLGLKNTDVKLCASSVCFVLSDFISVNAHFSQRGFIKGRNFISNILELDTFARIFSARSSSRSFPDYDPFICSFLCLFDFFSAFPSVAHAFMFRVLEFYNVPIGLQNFVHCLFVEVLAFTNTAGCNEFLF
eukprot:11481054-Karenia_brevis.AAC.1